MPPRTVHPRRRHGHLPTTDILDLDGVDRLSARAFHALITTARLHVRSMSEALAGSGCHHGQAICLRLLSARDGATQRELAGLLDVAPPTVSKMLRALEQAGLVERRPDKADRRLTRVHLTSRGREREREISLAVGRYVDATFGALPERERRDLVRLLDRLGERIAAVGERPDGCRPRNRYPDDDPVADAPGIRR